MELEWEVNSIPKFASGIGIGIDGIVPNTDLDEKRLTRLRFSTKLTLENPLYIDGGCNRIAKFYNLPKSEGPVRQ